MAVEIEHWTRTPQQWRRRRQSRRWWSWVRQILLDDLEKVMVDTVAASREEDKDNMVMEDTAATATEESSMAVGETATSCNAQRRQGLDITQGRQKILGAHKITNEDLVTRVAVEETTTLHITRKTRFV